jgi:D-alanyl-D-alanine dipeptidase
MNNYKTFANDLEAYSSLTLEVKRKVYISRSLFDSKKGFLKQEEKMVDLIKLNPSEVLLKPFWLDPVYKVSDPILQKLLNIESDLLAKYIQKDSDFSLLIRESVYEKLLFAQSLMPDNFKIVVKVGYRPVSVQLDLFEEIFKLLKIVNPSFEDEKLYKLTSEFVTDPRINIPPHSTGAAIDIDLLDINTGKNLDMGSPINYPDDMSWTFNFDKLNQLQIDNRLLLTETMIQAGFANLPSEWWHFSYGDQRWAIFYNQKDALYDKYEGKNSISSD